MAAGDLTVFKAAASGPPTESLIYDATKESVFLGTMSGGTDGSGSVFIGLGIGASYGDADDAVVIGKNAYSGYATGDVVIGASASSGLVFQSVVVGYNAYAYFGVAIGTNSDVTAYGGVAVGPTSEAGQLAVGVGMNSVAQIGGVAIGYGTSADDYGVAVGYDAEAGENAVCIGPDTIAHDHGVAIGHEAFGAPNKDNIIAIGRDAYCGGGDGIAIGRQASTYSYTSYYGIAIGRSAYTGGYGYYSDIAIGHSASGKGSNTIAIGKNADAYSEGSIAIGQQADADNGGMALGVGCKAAAEKSAAIGYYVTAGQDNVVEVGSWSGATTRTAAIRTGTAGLVCMTVEDDSNDPGDGGATAGQESGTSLPRGMMAFRRDGLAFYLDYNDGGTIKSISLGTAA